MFIIIVGVDKLGYFLACKLVRDKHKVVLIEKDKKKALEISQKIESLVICADGTLPEVLEEAGCGQCDCVVALTGKDEENIIISQVAKKYFGVKRTIAKVNNPQNIKIFSTLGVDVPIDTTTILTKVIEEEASYQDFINLLSIKTGRLSFVKMQISKNTPVVNKKVKDIKLPQDTMLMTIIRGDKVIVPKGNTQILPNDEIIALTKIAQEKEVIKCLLGGV